MTHEYTKTGQTVRLERRRSSRALIRSVESGTAIERDEIWISRTRSVLDEFVLDSESVLAIEEDVLARMVDGVAINRMTIAYGSSEHQLVDSETREWSDQWFRVHAEIEASSSSLRAWVDLGGPTAESLDLGVIDEIASCLSEAAIVPDTINGPLRLAPPLAALLWSTLAWETNPSAWLSRCSDSKLQITQMPPPALDGDGRPVLECMIVDCTNGRFVSREDLPNRFRPSYKTRPIRAPFHTHARSVEGPDSTEVTAIASLGPVRVDRGEILLPILCTRAGLPPVAGILETRPEEIASDLVYAESDVRWYPHAAGTWGGWTILDKTRIVRPA